MLEFCGIHTDNKCFRSNLSDFLVLVIIHDRPPDYDDVVLFAGKLWDTLIISRGLFVLKSHFHSLQECCPDSCIQKSCL